MMPASADRMDLMKIERNDDEDDGELREPMRVIYTATTLYSRMFGAGAGL